MKQNKYLFYILTLIALVASSACLQNTDNEILLQIENESGKSVGLKKKDLAGLPRIAAEATDKNGITSRFEGIQLVEVLRAANVQLGDNLRGKNMANYVVVEGADGYKVTFTLSELDPDFSNKTVILADKRDGQTLSKGEGKLRLVVPDETKRQARWVRQVIKLNIKTVE